MDDTFLMRPSRAPPKIPFAAHETYRSAKPLSSASAECGEASVSLDFPGWMSPIPVMFRRCPVLVPVAIPASKIGLHFPFALHIQQVLLSLSAVSRRRRKQRASTRLRPDASPSAVAV